VCIERIARGWPSCPATYIRSFQAQGRHPHISILQPFRRSFYMMAGPEKSLVIAQDLDTVASDLYDSLFLQSLLQHASRSYSESAYSADARVDERSEWHRFLDGLCFLCDFERAGKSVVSIGVEQGTGSAIFWITTTEPYQESTECHLREILHLLTKHSDELSSGDLTVAEVTRHSVERSKNRILDYTKRLERLVSEEKSRSESSVQCDRKMSPYRLFSCGVSSDSEQGAVILSGIEAVLAEKECPISLCKAAYNFRHSSTYASLKKSTEGRTDDFQTSARHLVARLGHWQKTATSTVLQTPTFLPIIRNAIVRSVQPPISETIRLSLDEDLQKLILRVFPTFKGSPMCDSLLERVQKADSLIRWFRSAIAKAKLKTKLHAEVTMLEYFHVKSMRFFNDDKYIACSKASCHCCALYFMYHPLKTQKRPCHGNVRVQWTVPFWSEGVPINNLGTVISRRMTNTTREISYASLLNGVCNRRRFESTIGVTTVMMGSQSLDQHWTN
jgi:hypothetical protein